MVPFCPSENSAKLPNSNAIALDHLASIYFLLASLDSPYSRKLREQKISVLRQVSTTL
jgi:hypothetical protein